MPEADEALRPHRDRITWDAPIHGVADIEALPFLPRTINVKPSRIGTLAEAAAHVRVVRASAASRNYGGGQSELGVGRGQIQYLASLFHAGEPNDIAPSGYDWAEFPETRPARQPAAAGPRADGLPPALVDWSARWPSRDRSKMEQKGALAAMQKLESRSDEELEAETRYRAAAQAILGARAAERMDAKRSREHFRAAIAAARPQERLQLRRMAEASLALAERRAGDLKVAAEKLGQTPPSSRQLLALRVMGVIAPPPSAGIARRIGGILLLILAVVAGDPARLGDRPADRAAVRRHRHGRLVLLGLPARLHRARRAGRRRPPAPEDRARARRPSSARRSSSADRRRSAHSGNCGRG